MLQVSTLRTELQLLRAKLSARDEQLTKQVQVCVAGMMICRTGI